jgi:hypothetical protein
MPPAGIANDDIAVARIADRDPPGRKGKLKSSPGWLGRKHRQQLCLGDLAVMDAAQPYSSHGIGIGRAGTGFAPRRGDWQAGHADRRSGIRLRRIHGRNVAQRRRPGVVIVGTVVSAKPHGLAKAGLTSSLIAVHHA